VLSFGPQLAYGAGKEGPDGVSQDTVYIWPTSVLNMSLANAYDGANEEKTWARLGQVVEKGYDYYVKKVLPRELELDPVLAEKHTSADGSTINEAWLRWQKRVFSMAKNVPIEELNWDGKPVPQFDGVPYKWKELHDSSDTKFFLKSITHVARHYIKQFAEQDGRFSRMLTFMWAEVYEPGDFQHMRVHTGAAIAGLYCLKAADADDGRGPEIVFLDPRGQHPPFGHSKTFRLRQHDLLMWPSWAPHALSVHPGNSRSVYVKFLIWPPGGAPDFDWEDDPTGDMVYKKTTVIRTRRHSAEAEAGQPATASAEDGGRTEL